MALPAKPLDELRAMSEKQRTAYFEEYAGYFADSPQKPYAIRIGGVPTLFSADTFDLRQQFDKILRYGPPRPERKAK